MFQRLCLAVLLVLIIGSAFGCNSKEPDPTVAKKPRPMQKPT